MKPAVTITVATICFNNLTELRATLASADAQTTLPYEHLIIDGSTDGKIRQYLQQTEHPSYRKWVSEADKGIADAFNKDVKWASGLVLNMLNAGDTYNDPSVLSTVTDAFSADADLSWLHGKFMLQRGGLWVTIGKPFNPALLYRGMRSLSHQSMFVKKELHDRYGFYDITLRNAMDYDFVCRIAGEKFLFIDKPLIVFAPGGTTDRDYLAALKEGRKVYEKYFGSTLMLHVWQSRLKLLRFVLDSPIGKVLYRIKVRLKLENA